MSRSLSSTHELKKFATATPRRDGSRHARTRHRLRGGVFTAVKTTGIFCRPGCTARSPKPANVEFFAHADECLAAGYRACLRCKPMDAAAIAPHWVQQLLKSVDADPEQRWTDAQLLTEGIEPLKLRRWFKQHLGMTFHAWLRTRRLGMALGGIRQGIPSTTRRSTRVINP